MDTGFAGMGGLDLCQQGQRALCVNGERFDIWPLSGQVQRKNELGLFAQRSVHNTVRIKSVAQHNINLAYSGIRV